MEKAFKISPSGRVGWECGVDGCTKAHTSTATATACVDITHRKNKDVQLQEIMGRRRKYMLWAEKLLQGKTYVQIAKEEGQSYGIVRDKIRNVFRMAHIILKFESPGTQLVPGEKHFPDPIKARKHIIANNSAPYVLALLYKYWITSQGTQYGSSRICVWSVTQLQAQVDEYRVSEGE